MTQPTASETPSSPRRTYADAAQAVPAMRALLGEARRVLICGHIRADGDCVGCMRALHDFLTAQGKEVRLFYRGPVQEALLAFLPEGVRSDSEFPTAFEADVTVCLDASNTERIVDDFDKLVRGTVLNIDHHADNPLYGEHNWVSASYAATGEMVFALIGVDSGAWTPAMAAALYLAIATDTGGFRYANTTAETLETAGRLVRLGADAHGIARSVWGERSMESVRIGAAALAGMRFELDGRLVWSEITQELYRLHGGEENEPDNLSGELRAIRGVEVGVLIRESAEGEARVSVRASRAVDAGAIAAALGGGGHRGAAGATMRGMSYAEGRQKIIDAVVRLAGEQLGRVEG
jgi:phosphoesterase RecJ-like protein